MTLFTELKRRNVFKVGVAYAVTAWFVLQVTGAIAGAFGWPEWVSSLLWYIGVVGFLPALIVSWYFELTTGGIRLHGEIEPEAPIRKKTGRKLEYTIIILLGLSAGFSIWEPRYRQKLAAHEEAVAAAAAEPAPVPRMPRLGEGVTDIDEYSIAVLPFANLSADPSDVYFTDGIHEDLLIQLARIDALSVISRSSVMEYRNTTRNLRDIARELSVANVMEGSVQRSGDRVRINVQLIDAATDEHLWAEIYDRELTAGNLFDIQSGIAQAIAEALKTTLTDAELADVADVPTDNVAAYDLYLQARQAAQSETLGGYRTAIELFGHSLAQDSGFKHAWIGLARAHMTNYWVYGGDPANRDLAREAIERARDIDADFAGLYMAEGFYWYWGHLDYERALYHLGKAIEMMPGNDEAYMWRGWVSRRAGLWKQAPAAMQQALRLNPRVHFNWHEYALTLLWLHRYGEARDAAMQARTLDPGSYWGKTTLARVVLQESGDTETAVQLTAGAQDTDDFDFFNSFMHARILARSYEEALEAARNISDDLEIRRNLIMLREEWAAQILHFMGRGEEAVQAASAALFRLRTMRNALGDDYRIDLAEAMVSALRGAGPDEVGALVRRSMASRPVDAVEEFRFRLTYARIFAIAGLAPEAMEMLEPLMAPPSDLSVRKVDLDPAFDGIRADPEFIAMLEQFR